MTNEEVLATKERSAVFARIMYETARDQIKAKFGPLPALVKDKEQGWTVRLLDIVLNPKHAMVTLIFVSPDDPLAPFTFCQPLEEVLIVFDPITPPEA